MTKQEILKNFETWLDASLKKPAYELPKKTQKKKSTKATKVNLPIPNFTQQPFSFKAIPFIEWNLDIQDDINAGFEMVDWVNRKFETYYSVNWLNGEEDKYIEITPTCKLDYFIKVEYGAEKYIFDEYLHELLHFSGYTAEVFKQAVPVTSNAWFEYENVPVSQEELDLMTLAYEIYKKNYNDRIKAYKTALDKAGIV